MTYEQPLNERMRTFLRLNFLFDQAEFHASGESTWESRAAISSLLDVLAILSRGDVRQEVIKELERYSSELLQFRAQPGVDRQRLDDVLDEITSILKGLEVAGSTIMQRLKESDFLNAVRHRSAIPGGTCEFDLPDYRHWLGLAYEQRLADFNSWIERVRPLRLGVQKVLWLLRESAQSQAQTARAGMFQHVLERGMSVQLLRVSVRNDADVFPEISGSQHRFTVRFHTWQDVGSRPAQSTDDINFFLACC
ncbi:MAG: cell division protein ZapD [Gammaproteobacteria bacterium]